MPGRGLAWVLTVKYILHRGRRKLRRDVVTKALASKKSTVKNKALSRSETRRYRRRLSALSGASLFLAGELL